MAVILDAEASVYPCAALVERGFQVDAQTTINNALEIARKRLAEVPSFPLYSSIISQLEYVAAVLDGDEKDRSRLKHVIVGHYGAREFEESDPELARVLKDAQLIASKMAKGLKV